MQLNHPSRGCIASKATVLAILLHVQVASTRPSPASIQSRQEPAPKLEWAVIGDSWSSGVSYNDSNKYDSVWCARTTEAWGSQMSKDTSWLAGEQDFRFIACGGSVMEKVPDQLSGATNPSILWGTLGGNDVNFGDIARACIYQPTVGRPFWGYGPYWEDDPEGKGKCKEKIKVAEDMMNRRTDDEAGFYFQFKRALDRILVAAEKYNNPQKQVDVYISSYVRFFDDTTDACDSWTFAHSSKLVSWGHPKVVKGLRKALNDRTDQINKLQAAVIKDYKTSNNALRVHNVQPDELYKGHRFCEPGHSFEDQFYREDVWLWNLQYWDTQSAALAGNPPEKPTTEQGVTMMSAPWENAPSPHMIMGTFPPANAGNEPPSPAPAPQSNQASYGWTARPFHPKWKGHEAMKDFFIKRMRDDGIPGVKGANPVTNKPADKPAEKPAEQPQAKPACKGLAANRYASRDFLRVVIEEVFCPDAVKQGGLDKDAGSIFRRYGTGTMEEVNIAIEWQPGLNFKPTMEECVGMLLGKVVDECDSSPVDNPANWKGGGRAKKGEVTYDVSPVALRGPSTTAKGGGCDSTFKGFWNEFVVWGNGWAANDWGKALRDQVDDCALLPGTWAFQYGTGSNGREWTAKFRTGIWQKNCVGWAIREAGGTNGCNGSG